MTIVCSLRSLLQCPVSEPKDPRYEQSTFLDNGRIRRKPKAVVHATCVEDIVQSVLFAKAQGLLLTVKAGGHSYTGYCLNDDGIVLDLSSMRKIRSGDSKHTLIVEMGCTWLDVYSYLETHSPGLMAVGGTCLSVGVAGFIMGGGYSFLSRSYGLGADNVCSLKIVTAEGEVCTISADSAESLKRDLFWACLGGGGGNFGVVVEATLRLHSLPSSKILGGWLVYPIEQMQEILSFYNDWVQQLPKSLTVYGYIGRLPLTTKKETAALRLRLQPVFNGDFAEGIKLLEPLLKFRPIESRFVNLSFLDYLHVCDDCTAIGGRSSYMRSGMLPSRSLNQDVGNIFRTFMESAPSSDSFMLWMHQGGRCNEHSTATLAFPHRDTSFVFEVVAIWKSIAEGRANIDWAHAFGERLRSYFTGAFINYIDPLLSDWARMYYGSNYPKLLLVKQMWDPDNFFRFQQSIGSNYEPKAGALDLSALDRTI